MRALTYLLFCAALTTGIASAKPAKNQQKEAEVHRFTGLTLKGQLKKPELSYSYKRSDLQPGQPTDQLIEIPENFNDAILPDAAQVEP